ncbi:MAG: hypothetical protein LBQ19_06390 [Synergistaceae bacterium]|nr:hypothetical protein [Synergistaceae bacterium]
MTYMAIFLCVIFLLIVDAIPDYLVIILALSSFIVFGYVRLVRVESLLP